MKNYCFFRLMSLYGILVLFAACSKDESNDSVVRNPPITPPVNPANKPPVARAGDDTTIYMPLNSYTLNAAGSSDPDGDQLSFNWRKIDGPPLPGATEYKSAQVHLDGVLSTGVYQFELTVTDTGKLSSKDTVKVTCIEPVCTSANKEVVIKDVAWNPWWIDAVIIENIHAYLPPNSYMKQFYIKRDSGNSWVPVIKANSDPANAGKVPEWSYENGTLIIYLGADKTYDTPDIKIEYCN